MFSWVGVPEFIRHRQTTRLILRYVAVVREHTLYDSSPSPFLTLVLCP